MFRNPTLALALSAVVLSHLIYNPITLSVPLYLQNVLGATGVTSGFLLAALPLFTAMASPFGGRLADRFEGSTVAGVGLILIVSGITLYSRLNADTSMIIVAAVLGVLGAGIGLFTPANQKLAFAAVAENDYGMVGAMLSSFGTAAGTIGTALAVALMETAGGSELWARPAAFVRAQQFAFMWLAAIGLFALWVAFRFKPGER
jgi:MFS family permease